MSKNLIINSIGNSQVVEFNSLQKNDKFDNVFIVFRNIYDKNQNLTVSFLELVKSYYQINNNFLYKNIIVVPEEKNPYSFMNDNILYILWFSREETSYFNKDAIRESHIWKNVEWGKREKNYSKKGKDPSNVWIPTEDDGKGKITNHLSIKIEGAIDRLFKAFSEDYDKDIKWYYYDSNELTYDDKETIKKKLRQTSNRFLENKIDYKSLKRKHTLEKDKKESIIYFESSENLNRKNIKANLMVTSPPYWNLKNYFKKGQIGQEPYSEYLNRINKVWLETLKVLDDSSLIWININIRTHKKQPYFIPTDFINQMRSNGLLLKDILIWHKSSSIPTTHKNLSDKFEVFLIFSKTSEIKINSDVLENFKEYKNDFINNGTIWNINRKAGSIGKQFIHPAIYPTELIERIIQISTSKYERVYDPFIGSGTTGIAAINTSRSFIGVEYNEGFYDLITHRIISETFVNEEAIVQLFDSMMINH